MLPCPYEATGGPDCSVATGMIALAVTSSAEKKTRNCICCPNKGLWTDPQAALHRWGRSVRRLDLTMNAKLSRKIDFRVHQTIDRHLDYTILSGQTLWWNALRLTAREGSRPRLAISLFSVIFPLNQDIFPKMTQINASLQRSCCLSCSGTAFRRLLRLLLRLISAIRTVFSAFQGLLDVLYPKFHRP